MTLCTFLFFNLQVEMLFSRDGMSRYLGHDTIEMEHFGLPQRWMAWLFSNAALVTRGFLFSINKEDVSRNIA